MLGHMQVSGIVVHHQIPEFLSFHFSVINVIMYLNVIYELQMFFHKCTIPNKQYFLSPRVPYDEEVVRYFLYNN